jgi:hypothetical protein
MNGSARPTEQVAPKQPERASNVETKSAEHLIIGTHMKTVSPQ